MSRLKPRVKYINLTFLGEGWQDAYIDFTALTFADLETLDTADASGKSIRTLLRDKFLRGRAIDTDSQPFDLTADDVADFDIETLGEFVKVPDGATRPKRLAALEEHFQGKGAAPLALLGLLYREAFHLSGAQLREEDPEDFQLWLTVEGLRRKYHQDPHGR